MPKQIHAVCFSPAGKTKNAVSFLAEELKKALQLPVREDSFTLPHERAQVRTYDADDLVIFGVPTYAGRVPNKALPFVQALFQGGGAQAIALVTFGNRSCDRALFELCQELRTHGFCVIGAAAVVCAHSFAAIGLGRPDGEDRKMLTDLAAQIADKFALGEVSPVDEDALPGHDLPDAYYQPKGIHGEKTVFLKAIPQADPALCDRCGVCARRCPMGSIPADAPDTTTGICIKCQACVQYCPKHARSFRDEAFLSHKAMLENAYARPAKSFATGDGS